MCLDQEDPLLEPAALKALARADVLKGVGRFLYRPGFAELVNLLTQLPGQLESELLLVKGSGHRTFTISRDQVRNQVAHQLLESQVRTFQATLWPG